MAGNLFEEGDQKHTMQYFVIYSKIVFGGRP